MRRVLFASSEDVMESVKCFLYITGHGQYDSSVHIIPCEFNPNVYCRVHVDCDEVFGSEGF